MPIAAGRLKHRITINRASVIDNGFSEVRGEPAPWKSFAARKTDVKDAERLAAAQQGSEVTSRFLVRASAETATISPVDELTYKNRTYRIVGVKDVADDDGIEITAVAITDPPSQEG